MAPKKKEHSNDLRTLVIRHYQNGDSLSGIAAKTLLSRSTVQYMVDKYKSTKRIGRLFGRARKRETDRLIQRKLKLVRRKSASKNELGISLHVDTIQKRAHELGRVARKKPYVNKTNRENDLSLARKCLKSQWIFGRMLFGPTSEN